MKDSDPDIVRKYVETAENQYRGIADPGYLMVRPLVDFLRTPIYFYRTGVLLSALEAGFHDVLDFGAGSCWLGAILYRLGSRVTFLEASATALDIGKKLISELKPVQGLNTPPRFMTYDGFTFPLENETMDRIVCNDAFHHIPNPRQIIKEMFRVLRPGGRIAFAEPGEGHGGLAPAQKDMKEWGVLEADVHFEEIRDIAKEAGFDGVFFRPFPKAETLNLTDEQYLAFQKGDNAVLPFDEMRRDLKYFQIIVLTKGPQRYDTRYPRDLIAQIEVVKKPFTLAGFALTPWKLKLRNGGDTMWLSPLGKNIDLKETVRTGGHVFIRAILRDADDKLVNLWHYSCPLPQDVLSGEEIEVTLKIPPPNNYGKYIMEFDLEIRGLYLFSDGHLNQSHSKSLKVQIEL